MPKSSVNRTNHVYFNFFAFFSSICLCAVCTCACIYDLRVCGHMCVSSYVCSCVGNDPQLFFYLTHGDRVSQRNQSLARQFAPGSSLHNQMLELQAGVLPRPLGIYVDDGDQDLQPS